MGSLPEGEEQTVRKTWIQDAEKTEAIRILERSWESLRRSPKGSEFVFGEPKSGKPDEIGIYFVDYAAAKSKEAE